MTVGLEPLASIPVSPLENDYSFVLPGAQRPHKHEDLTF